MANTSHYLCPHCRRPFALDIRGAPSLVHVACPLCGAAGAKLKHSPKGPRRGTYVLDRTLQRASGATRS